MRQARTRGGALASTLLIILFLAIFAFTLANLATFDLRTASRNGQKQMAFQAAQAGLDSATSELLKNPDFGKAGEILSETLSDGSSFVVSFDSAQTIHPFSYNNLDSFTQVTSGYKGRAVPPFHASLFSTGASPSGETSRVECLIRLEAIPYTVAGTGKVNLTRVLVNGADDRANVYSGSPASDSLTLGGVTTIAGDARSAGAINVGPLASVNGDTEPHISPESLPDLNLDRFRNVSAPGVTYLPGGVLAVPVLTGPVYIDSDITFPVAVTMLDATVFVDGDLQVDGLLAGTGTVFVNGDTNFGIAIDLSGSGNRLTLFSKGDINFTYPLLPSIIQGVLFSQGNITAAGSIQVFGAVYAVNESDSAKGNVSLGTLGILSSVTHLQQSTAFANYWIARGGEAEAIRVYWRKLR